jgi:hypothetical protein
MPDIVSNDAMVDSTDRITDNTDIALPDDPAEVGFDYIFIQNFLYIQNNFCVFRKQIL